MTRACVLTSWTSTWDDRLSCQTITMSRRVSNACHASGATRCSIARLKYDPSMRSYILDLDLGRQALLSNNYDEQESVERLPRLWRYSLLYCSLVSKADQYPAEAFRLAMMLHLPQDRFYGLVDLITQALNKVEALVSIAEFTTDDEEQDRLLHKIVDVITGIEDESEQQLARQRLGQLLAN